MQTLEGQIEWTPERTERRDPLTGARIVVGDGGVIENGGAVGQVGQADPHPTGLHDSENLLEPFPLEFGVQVFGIFRAG